MRFYMFLVMDYYYIYSQGPVVISRDHHDVSGTDSPFRETSNIYDGSAFTAGRPIVKSLHLYERPVPTM